MTDIGRPTHAVCPRIERNRATKDPKLFKSESAAERFLNSEVRFPLGPEAEVPGLSIEQARARRTKRKAQLRKERAEAHERIRNGTLHTSWSYPSHLQKLLNRHQGWENPVPVRPIADYTGAKCKRTLREFFPAEAVGLMPRLDVTEEIRRALQGRSGDYTCYLAPDWRFDAIEADAIKRGSHEYAGRRHSSIAEIVLKAVHDLEAAFQKMHPDASATAVSDFWQSWQVQQHIAEFCCEVAESETGRTLAGNHFEAVNQAHDVRVHLYRQLGAFAHEVLDCDLASSTEIDHSRRVDKTTLGRNIDTLRKECGWSLADLARATELDRKLVLGHVKKGNGARPSTLVTYANTFTEKLGRSITVAELEA
jgi:hypothetical protein